MEEQLKMNKHTFMVKLNMRIDKDEENLLGYKLQHDTFGWIPCFVEVEAMNLYQAITLVEGTYSDGNKYRIDKNGSYMKLSPFSLFQF